LSTLNEIVIKTDYPLNYPIPNYRKLFRWGYKSLNSALLHKIKPIAKRVLSVAEPSGRVVFLDEPGNQENIKPEEQITILTANLWHDWPRHRRLQERLACFVELVQDEEADIVLLQELTRTPDFAADEWLSEKLGMAYLYSRANGHASGIGFEEGLAVYSRFPLRKPRLAQLSNPRNPFSRRIAVGAAAKTGSGEFIAFSVHLGINGRQNENQFSRLIKWVENQTGNNTAVIGGDFNAQEHTRQVRSAQRSWQDGYRNMHPGADGYTHEIQWPWGATLKQSRLDYLFLKKGNPNWKIYDARQLGEKDCPVSDHKPVLIKVKLESASN
jgi:endonuclease/exonuclease/phosphatase family metal-dependent hydrolase